MQWFSHILDVFTPKIKRKFFDFNIFMNPKQWLLTQDLKWSLEQRNALQVSFITAVKLICYFVL